MIEVELSAVRVDLSSNAPVVLLQELDIPRRVLPIFIGAPEATAIAFAFQSVETPRPMTHDLMKSLIEELNARVTQVAITELRDKTYYADLHLETGERKLIISCRPSDAIAIAVRCETKIFVSEELMDAEGVILQDEDEEDANPEEVVAEFKEFLEGIRPQDFSS